MKKKIGFCIDSLDIGGAEKLLVDIIKNLKKENIYEISLITTKKSESKFYLDIKDDINYEYLVHSEEIKNSNKNCLEKLKLSFMKRKRFNSFAKKQDVIIDFLDGDFCKYIKKIKNKEKIIWLHLGYEELQRRKKIDKKLKYYNKIIVITKGMERELKEKTKFNNIFMTYNLIDFDLLKEKQNEKIEKLNEEYFLTVCRLDENQKDVKTLIDAYSKYKGSEKLYIIGDGPDKKKLESLVNELEMSKKIIFLGLKENPYPYMKNAKIFILSSKSEGFGLVLTEALYCGTKVISSDCKYGPKEILLDGEIGELFKIGDSIDLLKKIENSTKKKYLENDIKLSLNRFKKEEIINKIVTVIESDKKC